MFPVSFFVFPLLMGFFVLFSTGRALWLRRPLFLICKWDAASAYIEDIQSIHLLYENREYMEEATRGSSYPDLFYIFVRYRIYELIVRIDSLLSPFVLPYTFSLLLRTKFVRLCPCSFGNSAFVYPYMTAERTFGVYLKRLGSNLKVINMFSRYLSSEWVESL